MNIPRARDTETILLVLGSLGGEAEAVRERTARAFQRYATVSAATHQLEEQADDVHAKQVTRRLQGCSSSSAHMSMLTRQPGSSNPAVLGCKRHASDHRCSVVAMTLLSAHCYNWWCFSAMALVQALDLVADTMAANQHLTGASLCQRLSRRRLVPVCALLLNMKPCRLTSPIFLIVASC